MMELEQLLKLIDAMSNSALSSLKYEEKGVKVSLQKEVPGKTAIVRTDCVSEEIKEVKSESKSEEAEGHIIKSPLVGTFYAAPSEEADPFVQVGDCVGKGQTVAIVEAMKLMNEIESEYTGEIREVFVKNGEMVEYGQPLFRVV